MEVDLIRHQTEELIQRRLRIGLSPVLNKLFGSEVADQYEVQNSVATLDSLMGFAVALTELVPPMFLEHMKTCSQALREAHNASEEHQQECPMTHPDFNAMDDIIANLMTCVNKLSPAIARLADSVGE
jgi:hypothetical protein